MIKVTEQVDRILDSYFADLEREVKVELGDSVQPCPKDSKEAGAFSSQMMFPLDSLLMNDKENLSKTFENTKKELVNSIKKNNILSISDLHVHKSVLPTPKGIVVAITFFYYVEQSKIVQPSKNIFVGDFQKKQ